MEHNNSHQENNNKKIKSYAVTALVGGILQVVFGFGLGFVNLAIFLITLITGISALVLNKTGIKRVMIFSAMGLGLVAIAFVLNFLLKLKAPIDYLLTGIEIF